MECADRCKCEQMCATRSQGLCCALPSYKVFAGRTPAQKRRGLCAAGDQAQVTSTGSPSRSASESAVSQDHRVL